ncbi:MAG: LysM peptidoglycan-binding domain-containing protein [Lachnospiraceae bacterium]|nr:LysM peptidoglycan-binding domain-containing protein [Lachnospiraceae bacterium]
MGELYEPYPKLPKNIRQIGERDDRIRVYMEDYVNTYLKRLVPAGGRDLRAGLLLGNAEDHGGVPYVFIDGAVEMEDVGAEGGKVVFTEEAWKRVYQRMEEMFPKRTVQGWFLCTVPDGQLSPLNYWKEHTQYFAGKNRLMYMNHALEGEEAIYITSSDGFDKLRGHCIYYERNQMMQDYMVLRKEAPKVENGGSDPVIRDFRRKMEQKKETAGRQSHSIGLLRGMCGCLALLAMAGGVAALNSAERLKEMEAVMASALPDADAVSGAGKWLTDRKQDESQEEGTDRSGVIVEEAMGGVFPTLASGERVDSDGNIIPGGAASGEGAEGTASAGSTAEGTASGGSGAEGAASGGGSSAAESTAPNLPGADADSGAAAVSRQMEPAAGQSVYVVQEGETLYGICFKLYQNLSRVEEICELNGLSDVNVLEAGRKLIVP